MIVRVTTTTGKVRRLKAAQPRIDTKTAEETFEWIQRFRAADGGAPSIWLEVVGKPDLLVNLAYIVEVELIRD